MAEAEFYTYIHRKADTGEIFYVGKGKNKRAYDKNQRSRFWKSVVDKHGFSSEIVGKFSDEGAAFEHEKLLICNMRSRGVRLCNLTDGGEGVSGYVMPPEVLKARSAAIKEALNRPEVKERRSAAMMGLRVGVKFSEKHRENISSALKGRKLSAAHIESLKNKSITDIHRLALKLANARPDVKEKRSAAISKTMKGYVKTDEHRAALSAAAKADWAKRKAKQENK